MARIARVVVPGLPHHITQRGNRRQETFFCNADYEAYIDLLSESCARCRVQVWAYCLMPNHVHLIAVPRSAAGLRLAIGEAHRRYTRHVNSREDWCGYLWQGRFASTVLDNEYLRAAARHVAMNPVRARLARRPETYRWSSAGAHIRGRPDRLVAPERLLKYVPDFAEIVRLPLEEDVQEALRRHGRTGRPLGSERFVKRLERRLGRDLLPRKPGRKPKTGHGD